MQLKYLRTLLEGQEQIQRIAGLAWSPNQQKLAIATADRHILLYDDAGERRDKFSTKPANSANGKNSYVIRGLAFSPDSTRLAVAQSDCIVYVYKLGESWNDKKVICNKFPQASAVTALIWLSSGAIIAGNPHPPCIRSVWNPSSIKYISIARQGLEDGKIRALHSKSNKSQSLYGGDSICISLAANTKGSGFLSGHNDGTIIRYFLTDDANEPLGRVVQHPVPPFALAWPQGGFCVGGCDQRIVFYDPMGRQLRTFDYSRTEGEREFTVAACSPNGQAVAFGSYDRIRIYAWSPRQGAWSESASKEVSCLYTLSALLWRRDGARLALGSVSGAVLLFESVLRRTIWQDKFELIFVAPSQLLVRSLAEPTQQLTIESQLGLEIDDVRIMGKDNYLVARTEESLILCDLTRNLASEVPWTASGHHERFYFENPNVCLVFNVGELSLVEYGDNCILGSVRTEFVNPHVISVRLNERGNARENKKLAFLLDAKTICVVDLESRLTSGQINHETKIDWLELSETAHKLLFRDKKLRLVLVDNYTGKKQTLLSNISFVQWVPQSDVVVAQSHTNLAIWYNIDLPEHVTMQTIRGEAIEVVRENGRTVVRSQDGPSEHSYQLDEGLVEFGTAVNDSDFGRAVHFLESLGDKPAAKAMWHNLAIISLEDGNLRVVQRCYAALGNVSKAFYLAEMIQEADAFELATDSPGILCPEVRAKLALLASDLRTAERIYLEQGDIEAALRMYQQLRMWDEAVALAERRGYARLAELKQQHMDFLLSSEQPEKAGQVLEEQGELQQAMGLFLKANKPARAARLALKTPQLLQDEHLMLQVTEGLVHCELYELAGDIAHRLSRPEAALALYRKGGAYARALELARVVEPQEVTALEEEWGDWLVGRKQLDASINHYIEAGATQKALEAAVGAKQWRKAVQIAKVLDEPELIQRYALDLSKHLAFAGDLDGAEDMLVRANLHKDAIELLNRHGKWERAYVIGEKYLKPEHLRELFVQMAGTLEEQGKYRDAEKVLIAVNEPDLAIAMYKRRELYDSMIRLVERYHKDLLDSTHLHLARQLESRGKLKNAEVHFIASGDWKSAVHMYCSSGRWEDGYRVAKQKGTDGASQQVAYMWAKSMPLESAVRLLSKLGLLDTAVGFACDSGQFEFAMELCRFAGKPTDEVHLKIAMSLEDEGKFEEAEVEFLKAHKPKEAILMYQHAGDWRAALNVAEQHLPDVVGEVLIGQAAAALETRNYKEYEALLLRAQRPDLIVEHYKQESLYDDALRIAEEHYPSALNDLRRLQAQLQRGLAQTGEESVTDSRAYLQRAAEFAKREQFRKAAECLMQIDASNAEDAATLERALLRAAEICNQFLEGQDAQELATALGPRLLAIKQIGPAAQLYLAADMPKQAVDVFIKTEQWSKARRLAKEIDADLQLLAYVEQQQKSCLKHEGNVEQLADIDIISALDLLAEQGQWQRCLEKAKQLNPSVLQKYVAVYAAQLIREGNCSNALGLYLSYGAPPIEAHFNIYTRIALDCLALREEQSEGGSLWRQLRDFLQRLLQSLRASQEQAQTQFTAGIEQFLLIAHYYATRAACKEVQALQPVALRLSLALLRHTDILPVDKGFYEAGMDLRQAGREAEAFVMLNHYLDVCEAIEEGSGNLVDHSDLASTDFPSSVPLPEDIHLKNEPSLHEEVREWVLAVSMDQQVDQQLPTDDRGLYESSLGPNDLPCLLSGFPVRGRQPVTFQSSSNQVNRDVWSKFSVAVKMSPGSGIADIIGFTEKWQGAANYVMH
ncbi:intraflagellar transport protein 172 homolog isoform X1 [Drosophila pseudoobscura]|uniref:Intraflagellar transport protein 172 homolog isoform X1 n=1 Tax=Drosophila pseudoobscura pseudoobscura TaxID=46245 RepID=A0A6I8W380_DROPS|nr:intraflagellar transport protein 172 homolog isoform X1 [Drosophila pseudoobscura]